MKNKILFLVLFLSLSLLAEDISVWPVYTDNSYWRWEWSYTGTGKYVQLELGSIAYQTFWCELDGVNQGYGNLYHGYLSGNLKWRMNGDTNYCVHLNFRRCPDTDYCQKSQCGFYCTVHDVAGGSCTMVTCSKCGTQYCSAHCEHDCFSITCCNDVTHTFSYTIKKEDLSARATAIAAMNAARPVISTCPICNKQKCSICGHSCNSADLLTDNQANNQTANSSTTTANNTASTAANTAATATNTASTATNTAATATNTASTATNTAATATNTATIANNTTNISNNTTNISNNTTNISNNTTQIANNTTNMASSLNTIASGVTNATAAAQAAADKIPDQVENLPTVESPMEELPDRSDAFSTLKDKLLPSFSFFQVSGSNFPSWTFTIPASTFSRALSDITVTLGGDTWGTVAEGKLLWVMGITRALSYLVFAFMFLFGVIRALRQW